AVVVTALRRMHPADLYTEGAAPHRRGQIREGLRYVWKHPTLGTVLLIVAIATTFGLNLQVMVTLYASRTFHQGAAFYGLLMSCLGVGAVAGSLMAASWKESTVHRVATLSLTFGIANTAVACASNVPLALFAMGFLGMASSLFLTSSAGYVQLHAGER